VNGCFQLVNGKLSKCRFNIFADNRILPKQKSVAFKLVM